MLGKGEVVMGHNRYTRKNVPCLTIDDLLQLLAEEKNGRPNYGAILHYFRLLKGWTAAYLAFVYSEALGHEEIMTANWIYRMEHKNEVPTDEKRRWILARLLNIPPLLFGLEPLESAMSDLFKWEKVDVQEYRLALEHYNQRWRSGAVLQAVSDIKRRISNLREASNSSEKREVYKLLCGYLILLAKLALDQMKFNTAINHFTNAVTIAEQEKLYDLWAFALRERGNVYKKRGEITAGLEEYPAAQQDFEQAVLNYQAAQALESKVQPIFRGFVLSGAADAYAYTARDKGEFDTALGVLDAASKEIGKQADDVSLLIARLDEERYHLNKAAAYLAYPGAKAAHAIAARNELKQATDTSMNSLDRNASRSVLLAKSYLVDGQYPMAVAYTKDALDAVWASHSSLYLSRLDMIYQRLSNDPSYGKSADVALLGVDLLKAQKPELFH
jgi:tetratricopeptide (TPR) repeat protein